MTPERRRRIGLAIAATVLAVTGTTVVAMTTASAATTGQITGYGGKCVDVAARQHRQRHRRSSCTTCNGTGAQQWTVGDDGTIRALGKCLDVTARQHRQRHQGAALGLQRHRRPAVDDADATARCARSASAWTPPARAPPTAPSCSSGTASASANQQWTLPRRHHEPDQQPADEHRRRTTRTTPTSARTSSVFDPSMSRVDHPEPAQHGLQPAGDQPVRHASASRCCSSPAPTTSTPTSASTPRSPASACRPTTVTINGAVHAEADWFRRQRDPELLARRREPVGRPRPAALDRWAVSQAAPYRRMHVRGNLALDDGGWSSGGFISDSQDRRPGPVRLASSSGSPATRRWAAGPARTGTWSSSATSGAPANSFPNPPYTTVAQHPGRRGRSRSCTSTAPAPTRCSCPALRTNSSGTTLGRAAPRPGQSLPISQFYIVKPGDTAATINAALAAGQEPAVHPGRLPPQRHHPDHPRRTPSCSASAWPRSCRTTASPR